MTTPARPTPLPDKYKGSEFHPLYSTTVTIGGGPAGHGRASGQASSEMAHSMGRPQELFVDRDRCAADLTPGFRQKV